MEIASRLLRSSKEDEYVLLPDIAGEPSSACRSARSPGFEQVLGCNDGFPLKVIRLINTATGKDEGCLPRLKLCKLAGLFLAQFF